MILEPTVLISQWLKSPDHGVNAMLNTISRNKVGGGTYPKPRKVTIYDDCSDESVQMELEPDDVPAIVVFCDSDISFDMEMKDPRDSKLGQKAEGLTMVAAYIVRDTDPLTARQEGNFVLRAVKKSLNRYNYPRLAKKTDGNHRELNGVSISKISNLRMQRVAGSVGQSTLAGFVLATLWLLDKEPG